jgi:hypothetical protein
MKRIILAALVGVVLALPSTGHATEGQELRRWCNGPRDIQNIRDMMCFGYIRAVLDMLNKGISVSGFKSCLPKNKRNMDMTDDAIEVVSKWMENNKLETFVYGLSAFTIVAKAHSEAYTCK